MSVPSLPRPPECYRKHSSQDWCPACEAWATFVAIPGMLALLGRAQQKLADQLEAFTGQVAELRLTLERLREKIGREEDG